MADDNREIFEVWGYGETLEAACNHTVAALANKDDSRNLQQWLADDRTFKVSVIAAGASLSSSV
jgi:hypothetical protein